MNIKNVKKIGVLSNGIEISKGDHVKVIMDGYEFTGVIKDFDEQGGINIFMDDEKKEYITGLEDIMDMKKI